MNLYELQEAFYNVEMLINNAESDDELIWFKDAMVEVEASIEEKVQTYAFVIKNFEADVEALKTEEKRLNQRRKMMEKRHKNLKDMLFQFMKETGKEKFKYPQFSVSIRNNPVSVNLLDESKLSDKYLIPQPSKVDTMAIKEDLKQGIVVEGAELKQGQSLQIR